MRLRRALAIQRAISFAGVTRASWVVEARRWADRIGTGLTISADRILGAVRTTVGEHQRLVEAQCFGCRVTPARECFGLNLVEPPVLIEHSGHGAATIPALDAD
jgi:hypothetical protein